MIKSKRAIPSPDEALINAISDGNLHAASCALKMGAAALRKTGLGGNNPLHLACQCLHADMAKLLLLAGAETEAPNDQGQTPLMLATKTQDARCVQMLMEVGTDLLAVNLESNNRFDYADSNAGLTHMLWAKTIGEL